MTIIRIISILMALSAQSFAAEIVPVNINAPCLVKTVKLTKATKRKLEEPIRPFELPYVQEMIARAKTIVKEKFHLQLKNLYISKSDFIPGSWYAVVSDYIAYQIVLTDGTNPETTSGIVSENKNVFQFIFERSPNAPGVFLNSLTYFLINKKGFDIPQTVLFCEERYHKSIWGDSPF